MKKIKKKMKIKNAILTGLVGLLIEGCANLPNIYRDNLTVNSKLYKQEARRELYSHGNFENLENELENKARLSYILGEGEVKANNFSINSFFDEDKKIAYSKWKTENPKKVIIYLNGLESHAGWFSEPANELSKKGVVTYGLDRRGSGINTRIKGKGEDWLRDIDRVIEIAKKENPDAEINLASLCFGARLATAYALEHQDKINSLIYISPGFNLNVGPNPLEAMSILLDCIGVQTNTSSIIKKDEMFTKNPKYLKFLKEDKLRTRAPNSDTYLEGEKLLKESLKNLHRIKIPSLVLFADKDEIVDVDKTKKTLQKFGRGSEIINYNSEHTIFFENPSTTTKFINDVKDFML